MKRVCMNCDDRFVGCHAECIRYQQERAEAAEQKAQYDRERIPTSVLLHGKKVHINHLKKSGKWGYKTR